MITLREVTVTWINEQMVGVIRSDRHFSNENFQNFWKFFFAFFGILGNFTSFEIEKKIWKFLEVTVTWSNEQMVTLLEVMITSQVTITSQEVIVTSPINEQMVEAIFY